MFRQGDAAFFQYFRTENEGMHDKVLRRRKYANIVPCKHFPFFKNIFIGHGLFFVFI